MRSLVPPRSGTVDRKSKNPLRRPVVGARAAQAPRQISGGAGARREAPAPAAQPLSAAAIDGLPERLQTVMEAISGFSLAEVVVHRNFVEPASLGGATFAKGNQIHGPPGQERPLPHEARHVVQQKQDRVDQARGAAVDAEPTAVPRAAAPNRTGLPDRVKSGVEALSGHSLDDVRVHYNSARPMELQALAYTQGTEIHVGPGQEAHLPHEAWHVVQQKQGRVKPTLQLRGASINDDRELEAEADRMSGRAIQCAGRGGAPAIAGVSSGVIQRATVGDSGLAIKLSDSFEVNHLATTEDGAKTASKNRANSDGTLYNTVIESSVDDFKTEMRESEYDDWEVDGNGYSQYFNWENWYVTCVDTRQGKVVESVEKAATDVQIGGYFNENDAEPNVKITHIGDS